MYLPLKLFKNKYDQINIWKHDTRKRNVDNMP